MKRGEAGRNGPSPNIGALLPGADEKFQKSKLVSIWK
jgi:hypothetical protein